MNPSGTPVTTQNSPGLLKRTYQDAKRKGQQKALRRI